MKFKTMLEMQIEMNDIAAPGWRTRNLPWQDAIWTECAEMLDHIGWKWWKKQEPNLEQAKIEMVDIWHFGMSLDMDKEYSIEALESFYDSRSRFITEGTAADMTELIREIASGAAKNNAFSVAHFFFLMGKLGMSLDDLYTGYVGKNVLNKFRQANGYKEGTYIKTWFGEEDNVTLERIAKILDVNSSSYVADLEADLARYYKIAVTPIAGLV